MLIKGTYLVKNSLKYAYVIYERPLSCNFLISGMINNDSLVMDFGPDRSIDLIIPQENSHNMSELGGRNLNHETSTDSTLFQINPLNLQLKVG